MNIKDAKRHLKALRQNSRIEKCGQCECLHGAIMQIMLDWAELKRETDGLISVQVHKCLGCETCPPAEVWRKYLEEKEVRK